MLSNYCPGANTKTMTVPSRDVAVGETHADSHSDSEVGARVCVLLFSGPQFVWFITHPSHHYEQFYCFFQWGGFTLYGHAQVAWLQLLFLIKRIGSGIIWFCPVNRWLRVEKAGPRRLAWDSISETVRGLRADHGPCSAVQNAICLQSRMTPVFIAWQRQSTSHSPWWLETVTDAGVARARHNQQAGVKLSSDGKPVVFVARTGMAFQGGRRKLSQMDLSGMFTHCPN